MEEDLSGIDVPDLKLPEPEITEVAPEPLFTTNDDFTEATRKLIEYRKAGGIGIAEGES